VAEIAAAHRQAGHAFDTRSPALQRVRRGAWLIIGTAQTPVRAATGDLIQQMVLLR
jgi:hypothetical protein